MKLFDPNAPWKKTTLSGGSYTLRELLVPVFQKGECVYESPSVMDIQRYCTKEKDTISIIMNGARTLPASVLSGIKGKDISLNLDMENGFIWKINGTSITAETPADIDLSVTNTEEYIPAALYSLISTNQNDFGFHLGRNGAFDFPAVLSVKADASCAGLMANLFWYDACLLYTSPSPRDRG